MGLELPEAIATVNPVANIHKAYGPYASVALAIAAIPANLRAVGLTVGIIESGKVREYWWKEATTDVALVAKELDYDFASIIAVNDVSVDIFTDSYLTTNYGNFEAGQIAENSQQLARKTLTGWDIKSKTGILSKIVVDYDANYSNNTLNLSAVNTAEVIILSTSQQLSLNINKISGLIDGKTYYIKSNGSFTGQLEHTSGAVSNSIKTVAGSNLLLNGGISTDDYILIYRNGFINVELDHKYYV